jgi:hypothetical protein
MSRRIVTLSVASLLVISAAAATDPWISKDFKDWDAQDVQRILTNSPWSHPFQSGMTGAAPPTSTPTGPEPTPGYVPQGVKIPGSGPPDLGASSPKPYVLILNLTVSWLSSRTVREATARKRELNGISIEEARKDLSKEYDTFEVVVFGPDLTSFAKEGAEGLKRNSYLMPKKSKEKVIPSNVILQMGSDGFRPIAILFEFSRKTTTGEPTIGVKETGADFVTQVGKTRVKISFDISKMVDKKGTDL